VEQEVTTDDKEIVSAVRDTLADKVGKQRFEMWFGSTTQLDWDGSTLLVSAPDCFYLDWIRANFRRDIESACVQAIGCCPAIKFRIDIDGPASDQHPKPAVARHRGEMADAAPGGHRRPALAACGAAVSAARATETPAPHDAVGQTLRTTTFVGRPSSGDSAAPGIRDHRDPRANSRAPSPRAAGSRLWRPLSPGKATGWPWFRPKW
jgi:chromosomal replication initiation ATPase DnaA